MITKNIINTPLGTDVVLVQCNTKVPADMKNAQFIARQYAEVAKLVSHERYNRQVSEGWVLEYEAQLGAFPKWDKTSNTYGFLFEMERVNALSDGTTVTKKVYRVVAPSDIVCLYEEVKSSWHEAILHDQKVAVWKSRKTEIEVKHLDQERESVKNSVLTIKNNLETLLGRKIAVSELESELRVNGEWSPNCTELADLDQIYFTAKTRGSIHIGYDLFLEYFNKVFEQSVR